ncbi:MAG: ArsR family transcriptional regulator [Candidatus Thermochlorobacter aerophilum]|jgi:DNA-binding transcriptional ArsR family regulator|uniref:ArsR family transcriptional regulator n=1 Tax=Candidatus Thermochlorobacter aerophilus TaxID=1868324 RepID=A0A395LW43_9BACT|nr:MAG: ArsR family transcriptional regulator [Candidatus Thermochlorobacter aerophilum]
MTDIYMLRKLEQVRAIADPLRIRILNALCEKPMTTKQVAEHLGENINKLYHHVDALEAAGLVKLVETKRNRGTLEKYFQAVAKHFTLSPVLFEVRLDTEDDLSELTFSSALQATLTELKESLQEGLIKPSSKRHFFARQYVRTSRQKAQELSKKLQDWLEECEKANTENGEVTYALTATFYPVVSKSEKEKSARAVNGTKNGAARRKTRPLLS